MEQRSRPLRRLVASLKAVSDWMPSEAALPVLGGDVAASALGLRTTVLLPMGCVLLMCDWLGVCGVER